jgi:type IV pilus assembly protein PilV
VTGPGPRAGFTLIEVMVAMMLLSLGLLAVAGLAATSARAVRGGGAQTRAAAIAQSRFDSLSSVPCPARTVPPLPDGTVVGSGTAVTRGVTEAWSARLESSGNMIRMTNTLTVPGRTRSYGYVSVRACR